MKNNIILAAENTEPVSDLTAVSGVAYSGGCLNQYWSSCPIVIDLAGMDIAAQIPLMYNHYYEPSARLGEVTVSNDGKILRCEGGVDIDSPRGKFIADAGKKISWQLSIGAEIKQYHYVKEDETVEVNGKSFSGPLYLADKTLLREISVCAIGADPETNLHIAASLNLQSPNLKEVHMNKPDTAAVNAAPKPDTADIAGMITAELNRRENEAAEHASAIRAAVGEDFKDFAEDAIVAGLTVEAATAAVKAMKARAAQNEKSGVNVIVHSAPEMNAKTVEAALCLSSGVEEKTIAASYDDKTIEAAASIEGIGIKRMLEIVATMEGKNIPSVFSHETIRAAFTTVSLPGILGNVANKKLLQGFNYSPAIATKLCSAADLNDFKESERYRLNGIGDLAEVTDGGTIPEGAFSEDKATNQLATYGKMVTLTRQTIINDDLGAFTKVFEQLGARAASTIDKLFHARLLANPTFTDQKTLFHADHGNLLTGTDSALSLGSLEKAYTAFLEQTDSMQNPIVAVPKYLFVPSALALTGIKLVTSPTVAGGDANTPVNNAIGHMGLEVISSPYLQAGEAGSKVAWYLFADPRLIPTFEIGYLRGKRTPTVEAGDVDFNTLGISYRVYFDIGVREQGYNGVLKATGVA